MGLNAYSNCSPLTLGCTLYQDSGLTTPVVNGTYSDGVNVYIVTGGAGLITATGTCPTTTTTTTTTTTAAPTTTTTTTTTTAAPTTTTTTTTTTAAPTTTTTTTSTTTAAPTTTTTTTTTTTATPITCSTWTNLSGIGAFYDWTDCNGTVHLNEEILNNGTICAQDGTVSFISGGTLTQQGDCTPVSFNLSYSAVDGATACANYPSTTTYYSQNGNVLGINTPLFTDFALSTPVSNGFYSDGVNYYQVTSGSISSVTAC